MTACITTSKREPLSLNGVFHNCATFLCCAGPSLASADQQRLYRRGILTCAVNNAVSVLRPNLWVIYDHPSRFVEAAFRDPGILKFLPKPHLQGNLRHRNESGVLVDSKLQAKDCPCVFGYEHNNAFNEAVWLDEASINCGQVDSEHDVQGVSGGRSVMLAALKLLYVLGVRTVFLLGCDFNMSSTKTNYAFDHTCSRSYIRMNNRAYRLLSNRLSRLKPYFDEAGYQVFNCTPGSQLDVFPFLSLEDAIEMALADFPTNLDATGMYLRQHDSQSDSTSMEPRS